jgi:hypothetical protein
MRPATRRKNPSTPSTVAVKSYQWPLPRISKVAGSLAPGATATFVGGASV